MTKMLCALVLGFSLAVGHATAGAARAESLEGVIVNDAWMPIPGLTVFLVHPTVGRSAPKITDLAGQFSFDNVPAILGPYYLEVYWGTEILYRSVVEVHGQVSLAPILLY